MPERSPSIELGKKSLVFFNITFIVLSIVFFCFLTLSPNYKRPVEFQGPVLFYLIVTLFANYISYDGINTESPIKLFIFGAYAVSSLIAVVVFWTHEWSEGRHLHDWFLVIGFISILVSVMIVIFSLALGIALHHSLLKERSYRLISNRPRI